jgi:hypothetical protein
MWGLGGTIDLHPANAAASYLFGASGNTQVGGVVSDAGQHAAMWNGTTESMVDLHPAGYESSDAQAVDGNNQAGQVVVGNALHAMRWSGTAASAVDLNPAGYAWSIALTISGTTEAGLGRVTINAPDHAMIWHSTAASAVDLHPAGFNSSIVRAADGIFQGGSATMSSGRTHAMLWSGTVASAVDLNGAFTDSEIYGLYGADQFGMANNNPIVWHGSATNFTMLRSYMPAGYGQTWAIGRDAAGNIYGQAERFNATLGQDEYHAVVWMVPEPCAAMLSCAILPLLAFRGRRR